MLKNKPYRMDYDDLVLDYEETSSDKYNTHVNYLLFRNGCASIERTNC